MIGLIRLPCSYTKSELTARWDEYTSPARFAGSDETLDLIFVAKRKGDRVTLVRKAKSVHDPYASVFRGRIRSDGEKSEIVGFFTKTVFDYLFTFLVIFALLYVQITVNSRGEDPYAANVLLVAAIVIAFAVLHCSRGAKRRYTDFLTGITGTDVRLFLTRNEKKQEEGKSE